MHRFIYIYVMGWEEKGIEGKGREGNGSEGTVDYEWVVLAIVNCEKL